MIVTDPEAFRQALNSGVAPSDSPAVPRAVFLVEPSGFRLSEQTALDNEYMDLTVKVDPARALDQHRKLSERIAACHVPVIRFPGQASTPDDVFPNNAYATINQRFIIGAMLHPERQLETQRSDIRALFRDLMNYDTVDLSQQELTAELTGVLIIDRARRIGYCGMTQRVDEAGVRAMHEAFDLNLTFQFDLQATEYHTNVVMSVLASRALIICPDAFADPEVPNAIAEVYPDRVLELSSEEKAAFAGNCIALNFKDIFISKAAIEALPSKKIEILKSWGFEIHAIEFDEVEKAGGSVRCAIAEIY